MEKKMQVTREELTNILGKYIKDCQKKMGDKTNIKLPIKIENWCCGMGRNKKWSHTDIIVGNYLDRTIYTFTDKEITDDRFVCMLQKAIAEYSVIGRVLYETYGGGYFSDGQTIFRGVEVYGKPCKEFTSLANAINKFCGFCLGNFDVFGVNVCGKRSSWSDSGSNKYLCYNAKLCQKILNDIKEKRTSKDKINVKVKDYFSHGDEGDYQCAMYQESEWYGHRGNKLQVTITTPSGKEKLNEEYYL
jgi:hypothetical protein